MFKTTTATSPEAYIATLNEPRRSEIRRLHDLIRDIAPHLEPHLEAGMLAYGRYHYRYASGREGDWFRIGLASHKRYISLYVMSERDGRYLAEMYRERLPKADIGKSCVRFRSPQDVDLEALRSLIREGATDPGAA